MFLELNGGRCAATILLIVTKTSVPIIVMIALNREEKAINRPNRMPKGSDSMSELQLKWPNNARVAFVLGIALEAWDRTKPTQGVALQSPLPKDALYKWDWSTETFRDFGPKIGMKRLLDICDKYNLKVSIPLNGLTCVYYPELVKYCHERGHELVAHGWDMGERLYMLTREQERNNILKTIDAILKVTGERPTGWSSPGVRPTDNTVELLLEAGLEYHCDFHDDEMPYRSGWEISC
jgi:allantoinase